MNRATAALSVFVASAGLANAHDVTFLPTDYYGSDTSEDGSVVVGNLAGPFETFRWTAETGAVLLGGATVPALGTGAGSPDVSYDGTRISATILDETGSFATWGIWTEGFGWDELIPPMAPDGVNVDNSVASAWGLSGDGSTLTGFYWVAGANAQPSTWSQATGIVPLEVDPGRSSRINAANYDASVLVGWEENSFGAWQPTVWRNGVKTRLSENDAFVGCEQVTADGSVIVGSSFDDFTLNRVPTRWVWNGASYDQDQLGLLPGTPAINGFGIALGVTDDASTIVGVNFYSFSPGGPADGFIWTESTGLVTAHDYVASLGLTELAGVQIRSFNNISPDGSTILADGYDAETFEPVSLIIHVDVACNDADLDAPFGTLDFSDVLAFLGAFGAGDASADLAEPIGTLDFSDVLAFLSAFGAGCP
ncbi:MAG: GC-type dockerin domain-anchored protein [Phycisphaerales bacterium JB059]